MNLWLNCVAVAQGILATVADEGESTKPWLDFVTTLFWQLMVAAVLIAFYRSGILQKLSELHLTREGLVLKVQELRKDVDALRFLVTGFVTECEFMQLKKLATEQPFDYRRGAGRDDRFVQELIRLWDFGLIDRKNIQSWYDLPLSGDLRDYAVIKARGRDYLRLRLEIEVKETASK